MAIALFHRAGELQRIVRDDGTFAQLMVYHLPLSDEEVVEMPGTVMPSLEQARAFVNK